MNDEPTLPFIGVQIQENRTPTGRRTSTQAQRAAHYFAFGRDKEAQLQGRQRGEWLGPDGRNHTHEAVLTWARQEALSHRYTFQAILSVPQGVLTGAAFSQAMQQGEVIADWRLMAHADTAHHHAHVLFFRDQRLDKKQFLSWQTAVRQELVRLEQQPVMPPFEANQENKASQQEHQSEQYHGRSRRWEASLG